MMPHSILTNSSKSTKYKSYLINNKGGEYYD